jgi:hypothetical protein
MLSWGINACETVTENAPECNLKMYIVSRIQRAKEPKTQNIIRLL